MNKSDTYLIESFMKHIKLNSLRQYLLICGNYYYGLSAISSSIANVFDLYKRLTINTMAAICINKLFHKSSADKEGI